MDISLKNNYDSSLLIYIYVFHWFAVTEPVIYSFDDVPVIEGATVTLDINNDEVYIDNSK